MLRRMDTPQTITAQESKPTRDATATDKTSTSAPAYRTTFAFVAIMLAGIVAGWIGMLLLLWSRR